MAAPEPQTIREAVRLVRRLAESDLARRLTRDHAFAFAFEGEETRWYGAVSGGAEPSPGLTLARGAAGLAHLRRAADRVARRDDEPTTTVLDAELSPMHAIPAAERKHLQKAGESHDSAARITTSERGRAPEFPDRAGLRRIALALRAVVAAEAPLLAALTGDAPGPGRIAVLRVGGDSRAPSVSVTVEDDAAAAEHPRPAPRLSDDVRGWPVEPGRWLVVQVERRFDDGGPPVPVLLVLDRAERRTVGRLAVPSAAPADLARELLRGDWFPADDPDPWLASEIAFEDAVAAEAACVPLAEIGVSAVPEDSRAALREAVDLLDEECAALAEELEAGGCGHEHSEEE